MNQPVIRALPKELSDMIAAGEVVERPLSIVKELFENSVDAGATAITVEISKGGKEYIRVTDNGCGIAKEQLSLAFMRYATSKLRTEEDLGAIKTLGFRGEALASIAAVSRTELISKTPGEKLGARIRIAGSDILEIEDAACDEGTTIIVKDLFYNVPARLKFLKPDNTESSLITDFVSKMAVACPWVKTRLISNGTILFSTPGKNSVKSAILTVYSPKMTQSLLPVEAEEGGVRIGGFVSAPTYSEKNRRKQIFFVNGRLIKSRALEQSVANAYSDKLFEGNYPAVFLFIELDPSTIDVNIHPNKTEIRFFNEKEVSDLVVKAIRRSLLDPKALEVRTQPISEAPKTVPVFDIPDEDEDEIVVKPVQAIPQAPAIDSYFTNLRQQEAKQLAIEDEVLDYKISDRLSFAGLEYIGQYSNTYLILKDADGLYLIDQHAAHERVMYEKLLHSFNEGKTSSQQLMTPFVVDLDASTVQAATDAMLMLEKLGFDIREFGPASFVVSAIPEFMDLSEAEDFLDEFFAAASEPNVNVQAKKDAITMRACKSAVKAHDNLSLAEVNALLVQLDSCENPYSCPHGRPTFVKFTEYELEKLFKRK